MRAGLRAGRHLVIPAMVVALLAVCEPAAARGYTVEDLVQQESFGQIAFDPTGRWLVYERRLARTKTGPFGIQTRHEVVENQLRVVDTARGDAPSRALLAGDPAGVTMGPFSPDGRRLAVYGYRDGRWILGVATVASGRVRWLGIDAEFPYRERTVQWRSPTELIAIARPVGSLPLIVRINSTGPRELPYLWRRMARGEPSVTAIGSGRYLAARPRKTPSALMRVNVVSGETVRLATGEIKDLEVAPGGRHVAFTATAEDVRLSADRPVHGLNGTAWQHVRLGLVDLETGKLLRPCEDHDVAGQLLSWSPSGRQLLIFARRDAQLWDRADVLRITTDGRVETLALGGRTPVLHMRPESTRAAWLGETPAVLARGGDREDWVAVRNGVASVLTTDLRRVPDRLTMSGDGAIGFADGQAWWLTPDGAHRIGAPAQLRAAPTRPLWEARLVSNPPTLTGNIAAESHADGETSAVRLWPQGAGPAVAMPDPASRLAAAASAGGDLAALGADPHGVVRLELWAGGRWRVVDRVNRRQRDVDPLRVVAVRDPDGQAHPRGGPLSSWLYLPTLAPGAPPPPLVVVPYPGLARAAPSTLGDYGEASRTPSVPVIVGAGYAVLEPALPLAPDAEPAADLASRVLAIVDAAAAEHPGVFDPNRLALWGHSFGGYGSIAIIGQTDRFRAAVAMAPPTDLISGWGAFPEAQRVDPTEGLSISGRTGWTEDAQGATRGPPWADPARFIRNSPLFQADRIHTPLMLMVGDQDHIPMSQSEELFSALYRQDRDAMLLTYWGEPHIFYSPGSVRDAYGRGLAWLADHLKPDAGPGARPGRASATTAPSSR